ncbi:Lrp/AsnC family transcriptional regulator [Caviibacterium pharyngocola]|uniref:AsnC family transcriptional regulator n=1 Tax=Caviibacterium pharyngocola TaxID=28159 RepID=A0A2M8RUA0_9PAST|nr:Lrp/AsnC family transcriptional regulator [Caviibacterium pharyngocola]PJG82473.1 AsnC family transcriptional regulator [Caviibacterium pharyngocola]
MDKIDKKIIAELQKNGRISLTELCEKVGISLSPCQRRVKLLEQSGVISGYRAEISPELAGFHFSAIVFVVLKDVISEHIDRFENALADIPQITQAQRLFGDTDYMLHITTENLDAFQQLYDKTLSKLPNVHRMNSTLVMKEIVAKRGLPI